MSVSSSLLSGSSNRGFQHFTRSVRDQRFLSSSAFVLLPPSGSNPGAGRPRLADHLDLGNQLDADISLLSHTGDCSGDLNIITFVNEL